MNPSQELKPSFLRSAETESLIKLLLTVEEGSQLTYATLQKASGHSDSQKFHAALVTARKYVQREKEIVFGVVRGIGLKRCTPSEIVGLGQDSINKSRKVAKRGFKQIMCADTKRLSQEEMKDFNMRSSILALMTFSGSKHSQFRIGQEVEDSRKRFEPSDAIKLLQNGK